MEVKRLVMQGHSAFVVKSDTEKGETWYRVRIGYFNNLDGTREYLNTIR